MNIPDEGNSEVYRQAIAKKEKLELSRRLFGIAVVCDVVEFRVERTTYAGPMAFAQVIIDGERVEAVFLPEQYQKYKHLLSELGTLEFVGNRFVRAEDGGQQIIVDLASVLPDWLFE